MTAVECKDNLFQSAQNLLTSPGGAANRGIIQSEGPAEVCDPAGLIPTGAKGPIKMLPSSPARIVQQRRLSAFTLIELLIVVAIIAILAAIAVPNFLEAQVRSKVTRMAADMRTVATAIESYHVDYNKYPMDWIERNLAGVPAGQRWEYSTMETFVPLTSPVAYLSSIEATRDVFQEQKPFNANLPGTFGYLLWINYWPPASSTDVFNEGQAIRREGVSLNWVLSSFGPDRESSARNMGKPINLWPITGAYDPSNGTISLGDVPRFN